MNFSELEDVQPITANSLLVVDSLNYAFRYKDKYNGSFKTEYFGSIASIANSYKCNKVLILGDGGSDHRKEIYPEYKANREEKRATQTDKEASDFKNFFSNYLDCFNTSPYPTFKANGVEADDLMALVAVEFSSKFDHIWIISSDRDIGLLVSEKVSIFSPVTRKEYTIDTFEEHNAVPVERYIDLKILQGDKGDNVDKPEGLGPKRALELVNTYDSIFDLIADMPLRGTQKWIKNLNEFGADRLMLNYELMGLPDFYLDNIPEDAADQLRTILGEQL